MLTKKTFLNQLETLVSFKSLPGDVATNSAALDFIQKLVSPKATIQRVKNGTAEILVASNSSTLTPEFGYLVHVDIVSASDALFTMKNEAGIVKGRGVSDMKFSIPIGIALLNELIEKKSNLTFSLAITTDEEIGGPEGAAHLADEMKWRPKALIIPDGGDNLKFVSASKGVAQFEITTFGVSAHASRTWEGENAIPKMAQIICALEEKFGSNNKEENWDTTLNFGTISAGVSTNQVCDQATLKIDFRFPETNSAEKIHNQLASLVKTVVPTAKVELSSTCQPTATDVSLPVVQKLLKTFEQHFGHKISVGHTFGASDAAHFADFNIPILMIKPKGGDIHMESEWLDVDSTMQFYEGLRLFLLKNSEEKI